MRAVGSGIYRIILGTFPVIDLPPSGGMVLGPREGILSDLRLTPLSAEILDFGAGERGAPDARTPLRNHSFNVERMRLSGEAGGAMLLGHRTDIRQPKEKPSGGLRPENAGGLF